MQERKIIIKTFTILYETEYIKIAYLKITYYIILLQF